MKILAVFAIVALALSPSAFPGTANLPVADKIVQTATVPANGTNEVQTLTFGGLPSGGSFRLSFQGKTTGAVAWSATNATLVANIDAALEGLATIGTAGVTTAVGAMTAGIGTITVTFTGNNAKLAVEALGRTSALTGTSPTLSVAETTPGVTADGRAVRKGQLCVDVGTPALYQNTSGTLLNPVWAKISP